MSVLLETSLGDIVIDLLWEKAPFACKNFIKLCKVKYYNGALFYDVQKDYLTRIMHEKKEPTSLNHLLYGEQAKYFEDQIDPEAKHNRIGTVSTANVGPNMNNSNFFMTLSDDNISSLNGKHTIFGIIAEGADILRQINEVYVDERNRPYQNIRILHTPVLDDPFEDPKELEIPENSPEINYEETDRLDINDKIDTIEGHGRTEDEIIEETKKHEAKTKAIVLEMLNDLPDAEIKPPDNVLFVCKLNPVTQEDDLETIFSQFGPIKSCEVIRDWKTGASLQYSFIEFETQAACEEAYFKMENALIDERRIHVDFSQSVAKYWYKYKAGQPMAFNGKGGKGGEKEGGGGHRGPRLELKRQQREDRGSYGIVIDEDEAHRESRRHKNQENKDKKDNRENKPREENKGGERENKPREENRDRRDNKGGERENKPREEHRGERDHRRDDKRDHRDNREKERERRKSRSRSGERRREKDRKREEQPKETKGRRDRSRSKSPRKDKRDSGRDSGRDKERERDRVRDRTRDNRRDDDREKRHSEKDRRRDDHRSSRKEEKKRKQSSSSSRSSSSSSSSSGSRSSS